MKSDGFRVGIQKTRERLKVCRGDYSLRLSAEGKPELILFTGELVQSEDINPEIRRKLNWLSDHD